MYEEQNYNFSNINLDFLDTTPPLQRLPETLQLNKSADSFSGIQIPQGNQSSSQSSTKVQKLAQRIASVDALVQNARQQEHEQAQLRQQLQDFQQSAKEIQQLYETEKQQHNNLQAKITELQNKYDTLDSELANKTLQYDQLQAQLEQYKGPVDYSELAVKYLKMAHKLNEEHSLHWHHQSLVEELKKYCQQKNLRIPITKNPKKSPKRRTRIPKHEKAIQCELLPLNSPTPTVSHEKKESRCQGTQYDNMIETRSQATQHISTTTTRSTSTVCFIKQHHVGTCFPEPAPLPSVDDILHELVNWGNKSRITPIEDNLLILSAATASTASQVEPQIVQHKTIGTCTSLCNIRKHIDFIPQFSVIKRSYSRPPSRLMYDHIKHEASTPPPAAAPKPSNTASIGSSPFLQFTSLNNLHPSAFEELWQVFGHMLLGLLHHGNGNQSSISGTSPSDAVSQHEFHDWMRSLYESMQHQQEQLSQSDAHLCSSVDILSNSNILRPLARRDYCGNQERSHSPELNEDRPSTAVQQSIGTSPIRFNTAMRDDNLLNDTYFTTPNVSIEQLQCSQFPSSQPIDAEETVSVLMNAQKFENDVDATLNCSKENSKESHIAIKKFKMKRKKHRKQRRSRSSTLQSCESAVDFITSLSSFEEYSTTETTMKNNSTESENIILKETTHEQNMKKCDVIANIEDKFKRPLVKTGDHTKDLRNVEYSLFGSVSDIEWDDEEEAESVKATTSIAGKQNEDEEHKNPDTFKFPVTVSDNTNNEITGKNLNEQELDRVRNVTVEKVNVPLKNVEGLKETLTMFEKYESNENQMINHNHITSKLMNLDAEEKYYEPDLIIDEQYNEEGEALHYQNVETIANNSSNGGDSGSNSVEKEFYSLENISKSPARNNTLLHRTNFYNILSGSSNEISNEENLNVKSDNTDDIPNTPTTLSVVISNAPVKRQSELNAVHSVCKRLNSLHAPLTCDMSDNSNTVLKELCTAKERTQTEISSNIICDKLKVYNEEGKECNANQPSVLNSLNRGLTNGHFNNFAQLHRTNESNNSIMPNKRYANSTLDCAASLAIFSHNTCSSLNITSSVVSSSTDSSAEMEFSTSTDCALSIIPIEHDTPASPTSPVSSTTEHSYTILAPKEIPLELSLTNYPHKHSSFLQRILAFYSAAQYKIINSKYTAAEISERGDLETQINAQILKYLENSAENQDVEAATLIRNLQKTTQNDVLIAKSIVEHMKEVPRPEIELACAIDAVPSKYLGAFHRHIAFVMRHLHYIRPEFTNVLLSQIESTLFNYQNVEKLSLSAAVNLTKLYMLAISNQLSNMQANPARVFIAKCLYYHQLKAIPMVYEVLCCFPTTLPHREDRSYDRSDALITVIQHLLMCTKYDMENRELLTKELLSKLRFEYHFEPFKPSADEVLVNLVEKLKAGKLSNIKYAFAIFCKRLHPTKVTADVLQAQLIPLANEYNRLVLESSVYDERIIALLDCISAVIKPFPIDTNIGVYLSIFSHFLNAVERSAVQEAAVQAILRLQRFGHVNCFNALLHFKPTYNLHPNTKAMLKTFIHRKPLSFWRSLIAQTTLVLD